MATRLYFGNGKTHSFTPTFGAGWHRTTDADRRMFYPFKQASAMANRNIITSSGEAVSFCMGRQYLSDPMKEMTLSGTAKGQVRGIESNGGLNATVAVRIAKCATDGSGVVEILAIAASDNTAATPPEFPTASLTNRQLQDAAESASLTLASTTINNGDRLIVELGIRESNTTANRNADLSLGDDSATDLAEDNTTTTANNPWIEFSATIVFMNMEWLSGYPDKIDEQMLSAAYGVLNPRRETVS